jgi:hypothetical protein
MSAMMPCGTESGFPYDGEYAQVIATRFPLSAARPPYTFARWSRSAIACVG